MKIISKVEASGKSAYEDGLSVVENDDRISVAIFDGRRAWKESGDAERLIRDYGAESTGRFVANFFVGLLSKLNYLGINQMNVRLAQLLSRYEYDLSKPEGLPGCAATTVSINENGMISFSHLCDTKIILFNQLGEFFIPTIDNMDAFDRRVFRLAVENAKKLGVSPRVAMWEVDYSQYPELTDPKKLDYQHRKLENVDLRAGIGVLNGMSSAGRFQQIGILPIGSFNHVLICTDGLSFPCGVDEPVPWHEMIFFLLQNNFDLELLVKEIRRREDADREFIKYPRFAYHRDATGILIKM